VITQSGLNLFHLIMSTRILLLGSGGREHALVWKLARSPLIDHIYVCPGNPGTQQEPKTLNIIGISLNDFPRLVDFALAHKVCHFF
jgi:phosphoribosylamine--glycine ligase/phosphoribosylformylglycinamidine cyclo-ligase